MLWLSGDSGLCLRPDCGRGKGNEKGIKGDKGGNPTRADYVGGKEAYCLHFEPGGQISMFQGGDGNGMITQYIWDVVFSWL